MNRIITAAVAGALAFAAIPTATAQDLPAETTDAFGETYFLNEEGTHYVRSIQEVAQPFAQLSADQREKAVEVGNAAIAGLIDTGVIKEDAPADYSAPAEKPIGPADVNPADPRPVAGGFVKFPPVLTIGDTVYYLNADGHTYMKNMERVTAAPTPEEIAFSEKLVSDNESEVGRQAMAAARAAGDAQAQAQAQATLDAAAAETTRGMAAATGSNLPAQALAGLLIASLLGAAVFLYGRRRLV